MLAFPAWLAASLRRVQWRQSRRAQRQTPCCLPSPALPQGFHVFAEFVAEDVGTLDSGLNSAVLASNNEMARPRATAPARGPRARAPASGIAPDAHRACLLRSELGQVIMPMNEPTFGTKRKSQIQTYLEQNEGPGLQHLALKARSPPATCAALRRYFCDDSGAPAHSSARIRLPARPLQTDDIFVTLRQMQAATELGGFEFLKSASEDYYRSLHQKARARRSCVRPEEAIVSACIVIFRPQLNRKPFLQIGDVLTPEQYRLCEEMGILVRIMEEGVTDQIVLAVAARVHACPSIPLPNTRRSTRTTRGCCFRYSRSQ